MIAAVAAFNVNVNMSTDDNSLSAINLANVEALALPEDVSMTCKGAGNVTCPLNNTLVHKLVIKG